MVVGLLVGGAVVAGLVRLALWADDRGWIMVRRKHRAKGLGVGMMHIAEVYEPSIHHVIDEVFSAQTRADQDERGDVTGPEEDGSSER